MHETNRPWTGPLYTESSTKGAKALVSRGELFINQIKRFQGAPTLEMANANVDKNKEEAAEISDEVVVVVHGPGVACPEEGEIQENNNVEEDQPEQIKGNEIKERPQRERRPPDWFVDYEMNF